jgi:transposase-like protein
MDPAQFLREQAASADLDVLRAMVKTFADALMSAEADAICGAAYGQRSDERTNHRNGYRPREWDTRAGTVELAIPKLRQGSYFPDWLLQHRRRAEQALVSVVATSYLLGVSTRRVEKLVEQLGVASLSKSQVSEMAAYLDVQVEAFRNRPLDAGPYTFVWVDALTIKVREAGRTVNVHALIAVGVNADGQREVLGLEVASQEDGAGWLEFLRGLTARGLSGAAGHLRCPPRPGRRHRRRVARRQLAAVPHALLAEPVDEGAQVRAAVGGHHGADHLRPARDGIRAGSVRPCRGGHRGAFP